MPGRPKNTPLLNPLPAGVGTCAAGTRAGLLLPETPGISGVSPASGPWEARNPGGSVSLPEPGASVCVPKNVTLAGEPVCFCPQAAVAVSSRHTLKKNVIRKALIV